ncbi:MAG TPA: hypothetical protein PLI09_22455 [Candidatus Hydrogenedentes bacterium]|nr:hypothetical protein [Candidatus Hydrogenedentota bacterium]
MNENENHGHYIDGRSGIAGFFCAAVFAAVMVFFFWVLGTLKSSDAPGLPINVPVILALSFSGPAAGIVLWAVFQRSRKRFARGALVFAVVSFLVVGACWFRVTHMPIVEMPNVQRGQ